MWFRNLSPQRHRGTEKIFNLVIPCLTLSLAALKLSNYFSFVIPAKAGIQIDFARFYKMDSRFRGNDENKIFSVPLCLFGEVFEFIAAFICGKKP